MTGSKEKHEMKTEDVEQQATGTKQKVKESLDDEIDKSVPWSELSTGQRVKQVFWVIFKFILLLACLYFFICSLGLLEDSFQLLGGKAAGKTFQNNKLLRNPIAGLMIGVLATVLVQSSSTSTSIVITMVGSDILDIRSAIPIVMGANIGTSVTNTLVSLAQAGNRNEFRLAFAGATVHDMFNWLTVLVLLPLEIAAHYLEWLTGLIVDSMNLSQNENPPDMLKAITKPFTSLIVKVDKKVIEKTAKLGGNSTDDIGDVLKRWCKTKKVVTNVTQTYQLTNVSVDCQEVLASTSAARSPFRELCEGARNHTFLNLSNVDIKIEYDVIVPKNVTENIDRCENLFALSDLSDSAAGAILLVCSLIIIFLALFGIVKILHSLLQGAMARVIRKSINSNLPGRAAYFTGYIFILIGTGMTMILQSSSVFTSTLTPLVGVGVVTVERMYPLTLGANIGTTVTGILAALSQDASHVKNSLHVALCHLFFNITGIVIFYPIPFLRLPIGLANMLGRTTAKHRWFAIAYIVIIFVLVPAAVFALSLAGWVYLGAIAGPLFLLFLVIVVINAFQRKKPGCLPRALRNWDFLPLWMHSLKPVDNLIFKVCRCGFCRKLQETALEEAKEPTAVDEAALSKPETDNISVKTTGVVNHGFENGTAHQEVGSSWL